MKPFFVVFFIFNLFSVVFAFTGRFFLFIVSILLAFLSGVFYCLKIRKELESINNILKDNLNSGKFEKFVLDGKDYFVVLKEYINNLYEITAPLLKMKKSALGQIRKIVDVMDFPVILLSYNGKIILYNKSAEIFLRKGCDTCFYFEVVKDIRLSDVIGRCLNTNVNNEEFGIFGRIYKITNFRNLTLTGEELVLCMFEDVTSERERERFEREFVSAVSHELKTPLSVISASSEIILDETVSVKEKRKFATLIKENAERMNDLVKKLLILTEIRSEKRFKKERINLKTVTESVLKEKSREIKKKNIVLKKELEDAEILGNSFLLSEMLGNILDNAIKYTDNGSITVLIKKENAFAIILIKDTGTGIKKEALSHIFEPFYREDTSRARVTGGTGLGLTIAKRVANLHKGNITVRSEPGKGTEFVIQIPVTKTF